MSLRVVMSTRPTVRMPYSAGSAPVTSDMLPIRAVSRTLPKPVTPSGSITPLMRNCTLAWSLRTWIEPLAAESCDTPGACSSTFSTGALVPCGSAWMAVVADRGRTRANGGVEIAARLIEAIALRGELLGGGKRRHDRGPRSDRARLGLFDRSGDGQFRKRDLRACCRAKREQREHRRTAETKCAITLHSHDAPLLHATTGRPKRPAHWRWCGRGTVEKGKRDAAFSLASIAGAKTNNAQQCRSSAPTADQTAGGARDRKATRRGSMMPKAVPNECSMWRNPTGTGSGGGCDTNDVEARKIDAQIAQ